MNKFLLVLLNPDGPDKSRLNQLLHSLSHPTLERIFECDPSWPAGCPYPIVPGGVQAPVLKFMLMRPGDKYQEVGEMTGTITRDSIMKRLDSYRNEEFPDTTGTEGGGGIIPGASNPGGPLLSLGLFNLPGNTPPWLWFLIAGLGAYKAATSKSPAGMYGWGALGLVAALNGLNARRGGISGKNEFRPPMRSRLYKLNATGDVVAGDVIKFDEGVFGGSYKKPTFKGMRTIEARVLAESYGAAKQQHTFTLEILKSNGVEGNKYNPGDRTTRKGRNIYRNGTWRKEWKDEELRKQVADEKHSRGDRARAWRDERRSLNL